MYSPSQFEPVSLPLPGPTGMKKRETRKGLRKLNAMATAAPVTTRAAARKPLSTTD
jgi:hypothetical protein